MENLYAAIGAKRVKEALLGVVRMSLLQWNLDLTNLYNYNEVLGITNNFLQPIQNDNKMYGTEP